MSTIARLACVTLACCGCLIAPAAAGQLAPVRPPLPSLAGPPVPPALVLLNTGTIYEYTKVRLDMRIDHYPYQDMDLNRLPRQLGDFKQMPAVNYAPPNPQRAADGSIRFSVIGFFFQGSSVDIRTVNPSTNPDGTILHVSARQSLGQRATYTITNTWSLRDRLNPRLSGSGPGSFCNGNPGIGPAVGVVEENGKLTFLGRSGPFGTACSFFLTELVEAGAIVSASWRVVRNGPGEQCNAHPAGMATLARGMAIVGDDGQVSNMTFNSAESEVADASGVVYLRNNSEPVSVLRPTLVQYGCPITLGTDVRSIRFILDSVTVIAAPGRRFP